MDQQTSGNIDFRALRPSIPDGLMGGVSIEPQDAEFNLDLEEDEASESDDPISQIRLFKGLTVSDSGQVDCVVIAHCLCRSMTADISFFMAIQHPSAFGQRVRLSPPDSPPYWRTPTRCTFSLSTQRLKRFTTQILIGPATYLQQSHWIEGRTTSKGSHLADVSLLTIVFPERSIYSSSSSVRGAFASSLASSCATCVEPFTHLYHRIPRKHHTIHRCFTMLWSRWPWLSSTTPNSATSRLANTLPRRQRASWKPNARSRTSAWYKRCLSLGVSTAPRAIRPWATCTSVSYFDHWKLSFTLNDVFDVDRYERASLSSP